MPQYRGVKQRKERLKMDTSNSLSMFEGEVGDKKSRELACSIFPEDKELFGQIYRARDECVSTLKPLLKYVTEPVLLLPAGECYSHSSRGCTRRAIVVGISGPSGAAEYIFLDEDGRFFGARLCRHSAAPRHFHDKLEPAEVQGIPYLPTWDGLPFREFFTNLRDVFAEAQARREKHLASITKAREMLDAIAQLLNTGPVD